MVMACRQACSTSYAAGASHRSCAASTAALLRPRLVVLARSAAAPHHSQHYDHHSHQQHGSGSDHEGDHVHPDPSKGVYPSFQEEKDVSHEAFMHAMEAARPKAMCLPGMQEFAASVWERRRRIPSSTYTDPLDHIFTEFDTDSDGYLSAKEIASALVSRGVQATEDQVQMFIEASDSDKDHLVARRDFPSFIWHMASADLRSVSTMAAPSPPQRVTPTPPTEGQL